jgi:hypothetical protein
VFRRKDSGDKKKRERCSEVNTVHLIDYIRLPLQLIDAQLSCRMRALEAQEQEERKRKLQAEIDAIEMENRKRLMLDPTMMTQ